MSARSSSVNPGDLARTVRQIVASVLMVRADQLRPDTALIRDLGAESIDFLDLTFRLEEALGKKVPVGHWQAFIEKRLRGQAPEEAITMSLVEEFAEEESHGGVTPGTP